MPTHCQARTRAHTSLGLSPCRAACQAYPTDYERYRDFRLAEEHHARPPEERLLCQLRTLGEQRREQTDDAILSRLALYKAPDHASDQSDEGSQERQRFLIRLLRAALRTLSPRTRTIVLAATGKSQDQLARDYGISRQRINAVIHTAHRQLAEAMYTQLMLIKSKPCLPLPVAISFLYRLEKAEEEQ